MLHFIKWYFSASIYMILWIFFLFYLLMWLQHWFLSVYAALSIWDNSHLVVIFNLIFEDSFSSIIKRDYSISLFDFSNLVINGHGKSSHTDWDKSVPFKGWLGDAVRMPHLQCQPPLWVPFMEATLPIQLTAKVPKKPAKDGSNPWAPELIWKARRNLHVPGLGSVKFLQLQLFGEWIRGCKISLFLCKYTCQRNR